MLRGGTDISPTADGLVLSHRRFEGPQFAARLAWLRARPHLLAGIPTEAEDVTPEQSERIRLLANSLIGAGLLTRNTYAVTGSTSLRRLVRLAREGA